MDCNFWVQLPIICCLYVFTAIASLPPKKRKSLWPLLSPWIFHLFKLQVEEFKPTNPLHHIHWEVCKCCLLTVKQAEQLAGWFLFAWVSCVISEDLYLPGYTLLIYRLWSDFDVVNEVVFFHKTWHRCFINFPWGMSYSLKYIWRVRA